METTQKILPMLKGEQLFNGSILDLHNASQSILNGVNSISITDMELCVTWNNFNSLECVKSLRGYKSKMKDGHPAIEEFKLMIDNLMKSVSYDQILLKEFKVSRQRNLDLELALIQKNEDAKMLNERIAELEKKNEILIAGL